LGAYPNPCNPLAQVRFTVGPAAQVIHLAVYDPRGRLVRTLAAGSRAAGTHAAVFDGRDDAGRAVPSGVYFLCLQGPGISRTGKLVLVR
jgi:flagellar hook assembly protein FlgD